MAAAEADSRSKRSSAQRQKNNCQSMTCIWRLYLVLTDAPTCKTIDYILYVSFLLNRYNAHVGNAHMLGD